MAILQTTKRFYVRQVYAQISYTQRVARPGRQVQQEEDRHSRFGDSYGLVTRKDGSRIPCEILVSESRRPPPYPQLLRYVTALDTVTPYIQTPSRDGILQASASQQGRSLVPIMAIMFKSSWNPNSLLRSGKVPYDQAVRKMTSWCQCCPWTCLHTETETAKEQGQYIQKPYLFLSFADLRGLTMTYR